MDQKTMMYRAHKRITDACKTFLEIQDGPNPLTPEEIKAMCERRPEFYYLFKKWAE